MNQVSKSKFKARALEYFRQVETSGEPLIVTDHGLPTLEVRPFRDKSSDPLALLRGSVLRFEKPTEPVGDDEWETAQ